MIKYMAVAVAVAVAVIGGGGVAVAVPVADLTKRFFNHIQKDFLINVWGKYRPKTLGKRSENDLKTRRDGSKKIRSDPKTTEAVRHSWKTITSVIPRVTGQRIAPGKKKNTRTKLLEGDFVGRKVCVN